MRTNTKGRILTGMNENIRRNKNMKEAFQRKKKIKEAGKRQGSNL